MATEINDIQLREAETNEEKMLLGFLHDEAKRVQYGQIVLEFNIRAGKLQHIKSKEISRTLSIGK